MTWFSVSINKIDTVYRSDSHDETWKTVGVGKYLEKSTTNEWLKEIWTTVDK